MPRPRKCRKVCHFPRTLLFSPEQSGERGRTVILTVDEYETIRLIDREGLSQEQCGDFMQIARTTVQQIYTSARHKLADVLVEGLPLRIEGGDYRLCDGGDGDGLCVACYKQKFSRKYAKPKGETGMRVAVTYENGQIFQHFGHTQQFKVYETDQGKVASSGVVDTAGQGQGALAGVLHALNVDALICGGIGGGAQAALSAAGIRLYGGVTGDADAAVEALLDGSLEYNPDVHCDHHGHSHGGEHDCGSHDCGGHSCGNRG